MTHFDKLVNKLHENSLLTYYDMLKIYKKINGNIFGNECIIYKTNHKKDNMYYCLRSKRVALLHYLVQSINPKIPKINNYSYKRICETNHCICLKHYKRYISRYRERNNNKKVNPHHKDDLTPKGCLVLKFET